MSINRVDPKLPGLNLGKTREDQRKNPEADELQWHLTPSDIRQTGRQRPPMTRKPLVH